jgi:hypothetical protein
MALSIEHSHYLLWRSIKPDYCALVAVVGSDPTFVGNTCMRDALPVLSSLNV